MTNNFSVTSGPAGKHFKIGRPLTVNDFKFSAESQKIDDVECPTMYRHRVIFSYNNDDWTAGLLREAIDDTTRHLLLLSHIVNVDSVSPDTNDAIIEEAKKEFQKDILQKLNSFLEQQARRSYGEYRQNHVRWLATHSEVDTSDIDSALSVLNDAVQILQARKQIRIFDKVKTDSNFAKQEIEKQMLVLANPRIKQMSFKIADHVQNKNVTS